MAGIKGFANQVERGWDDLMTTGKSFLGKITNAVGTYCAQFSNQLMNGNMAGINYQEASAINDEIENYITKIDEDIQGVSDQAEELSKSGLKGDQMNAAIGNFVQAVKTAAHNHTSQLRQFQDILNRAIAAYKERDVEISGSLDDAGEEAKSSVEELERFSHQA